MEIMNCKNQKFGHNYIGGICLDCRGSQMPLQSTEVDIFAPRDLFALLAKRKKQKMQWTRHQQDAVETAKLFEDMGSIGIYMRLFKRHSRESLMKCRDWIEKNCKENKGRIFVKIYRKFL